MNIYKSTRPAAACFLAVLVTTLTDHRADAEDAFNNLVLSPSSRILGEPNDLLAQPFLLDSNSTVASASLRLVRYRFAPSGTLEVQIWDDNGSGVPANPVGTLGTIAADLGLPPGDVFVPFVVELTFDDPVTGLSPGSPYHLVLSYLNVTTADAEHQIAWSTVQSSTGTNGAGEALAKGDVSGPNWVNISSFVRDSRYNYFQMSITTVPEPCSIVLACVACAALLGYMRRISRGGRLPRLAGIASAILLMLAVLPAAAETVHSNFGIGDSYDNSGGTNSGYFLGIESGTVWEHAEFFVPNQDVVVDSVEIALGFVSGQNGVVLELAASDSGGDPGAVIESFLLTNLDPYATGGSIQFAVSVLQPTVHSATQYWLVARSIQPGSSLARWHINAIGDFGVVGTRRNGETWSTFGSGQRGAFRVTGAAIPEPASLALITFGLLNFNSHQRRR